MSYYECPRRVYVMMFGAVSVHCSALVMAITAAAKRSAPQQAASEAWVCHQLLVGLNLDSGESVAPHCALDIDRRRRAVWVTLAPLKLGRRANLGAGAAPAALAALAALTAHAGAARTAVAVAAAALGVGCA